MVNEKRSIVYYVTEYPGFADGIQVRTGQLSTKNKCDYFIRTLTEIGYKVVVLSDSKYIGKNRISKGERIRISKNAELVNFWCFRNEAGILRCIKNRCCKTQMYLYMLFHMLKGDNVLVYHDYAYADAIRYIQKIKRFNLILEIEDIYNEVWTIKKKFIKAEKAILREPYKSTVVSERMKSVLKRPDALVSYGSYSIYEGDIDRAVNIDKILIVCTGSFDVNRGTGILALDTIESLPDNYLLYISGKIQPDSVQYFINRISEINNKAGFEKCKFLGLLNEEEYEKLMLKANIGLNTQREGEYSAYIFPSKLIKYLSYNLDIVTTPGDSIINSALNNCFHIAKTFQTNDIVNCILDIELGNHVDYRNILKKMHRTFKENLFKLIEE